MFSFKFDAIGTAWNIEVEKEFLQKDKLTFKDNTFKIISEFDESFSRFKKNSWVSKCRNKKGTYSLPKNALKMLDLYKKLYIISEGLFTPTIGVTMEDVGYDTNYTLKPKSKILSPPSFTDNVSWNAKNIHFKKVLLLDFGALGKGYLVDLISNYYKKNNLQNFYIDAGGDIYYSSKENKKIKIALEHPSDPSMAIGYCEIVNKSICASSGNRRKWNKFHHTINPFTLSSPEKIIATWVIADEAILADALSTCLFLDPNPEKYQDFEFECVLLYKDYRAFVSNGFIGEIFTKK